MKSPRGSARCTLKALDIYLDGLHKALGVDVASRDVILKFAAAYCTGRDVQDVKISVMSDTKPMIAGVDPGELLKKMRKRGEQ
jgi:hypothetical protein